jgi:hypothetical protein
MAGDPDGTEPAAAGDPQDPMCRHSCKGWCPRALLSATPWARLGSTCPRYLKGISRRLERHPQNPARDEQQRAALATLWAHDEQRLRAPPQGRRHRLNRRWR